MGTAVAIAANCDTATMLEEGRIRISGSSSAEVAQIPAGLTNVVAGVANYWRAVTLVNDGRPFIFRQPVGAAISSGASALLSLGVTGETPLSYQWFHNGVALPNARNSTLDLQGLYASDTGAYSVTVSNRLGSVTSANTLLAVTDSPPLITLQPANATVMWGKQATFSVAAKGSLPLSYQWQFNGTDILGATGAVLVVNEVSSSSVGTYRVLVRNAYGSLTSSNALLTFLPSSVIAWATIIPAKPTFRKD